MAKKKALVCKPCGSMVLVSDLGYGAVVECYECGTEMVPETAKKPAAKKAVKAAAPKKAAVKKVPAAKKAAPKKKK